MAVLAIVKASGAAVTYDAGALSISGQGKVTHEHIAALDRTGGLDWVSDEMRTWFYSPQIVAAVASPTTATPGGIEGYTDSEVRQFIEALPTPYYKEQFLRIYESAESFKGEFNWYAFLFGGLWALGRRLWHVFGVTVGVAILASIVAQSLTRTVVDPYSGSTTTTGPGSLVYLLAAVGIGVWLGLKGTWIVYNDSMKGKSVLF